MKILGGSWRRDAPGRAEMAAWAGSAGLAGWTGLTGLGKHKRPSKKHEICRCS